PSARNRLSSAISLLRDASLHGFDKLRSDSELVVLGHVLTCQQQDIVDRSPARNELTRGSGYVGAPKDLLHLDLLHCLPSRRPCRPGGVVYRNATAAGCSVVVRNPY